LAEDVTVFLPATPNQNIYNDELVVNFEAKVPGPFIVTLKNMYEDELMKKETPETSVSFDLSATKLANESSILVQVKPKSEANKETEKYTVKRLSAIDREKIKKALADVMPEVKDGTAMDYLVLAGFYENHNLLIDALAAYEKAMTLAPDVPSFKDSYETFLYRNKLKEEVNPNK
jgi:hypothetical protein